MLHLSSVSNTPIDTQTVQDASPPTLQERRASLLEALKHPQDQQIHQLLQAIRHDPDTAMAGIVGEVYFEADEPRQLAMDTWSQQLSCEQRFMFEARKEDARSMGFSKRLTVALGTQDDQLLEVLLKDAQEPDHDRLRWLVGMHCTDASATQKKAIDVWRATLTDVQAREASPHRPKEHHLKEMLPFLEGSELMKMTALSKSLKQTIDQDPEYRQRMLHHRIAGFSREPRDSRLARLDALLEEISALDEPQQLAALKGLIVAISQLDDGWDLKETETVLDLANSTLSMASRAALLETAAEHFVGLRYRQHASPRYVFEETHGRTMTVRFLRSLDLLEPPTLRIRPFVVLAQIQDWCTDSAEDEQFFESVHAVRIADLACEHLPQWLHVLHHFSGGRELPQGMGLELEHTINTFRHRNQLSQREHLELLSMLLRFRGVDEINARLLEEDLVPALVPGQALNVVARHVAGHVCNALDGRHLAALADYIEGAPAEQQAELSLMLSDKLSSSLDRLSLREGMAPEALSQFFLTSVRLLSRLPAEDRLFRAVEVTAIFFEALNSDTEIYQVIRNLPRQTKLEITDQIENVLRDLAESPRLNRAYLLKLQGIRETLS